MARKAACVLAGMGLLWVLTACAAPLYPAKPLAVAASIAPLADFAREVGGDRVAVEMLVPPAASPHTYEPTSAQLRFVSAADILVLNDIGLEFWADNVIQAAANRKLRVVNASEGIAILAGDEHDAAGNPHVWLSPLNAIHQVEQIAQAFSAADPAGADTYRANAEAYATQLMQLHQEFLQRSRAFTSREIITFHAAWDYFAEAYDLKVAAVIETTPGKEPSPAEVVDIIQTARRIGAKAIFAEAQYSRKAADVIAEESGAEVLLLNPLGYPPGYSYIDMMQRNFAEIEKALR